MGLGKETPWLTAWYTLKLAFSGPKIVISSVFLRISRPEYTVISQLNPDYFTSNGLFYTISPGTTKNIHLTRNFRWISMEILRISQSFVSGKNHTPRHCARSSPMWASAWAAWAMARDSGVCSRPTGSWWRPWGGDEEVLAEREFCWQIIGQWRKWWGKSWDKSGENDGNSPKKMKFWRGKSTK